VAHPPQEWFFNTPVLWLTAVVLIFLLRWPLRNAPGLLKRVLKVATVSLGALGFALFLLSPPIQQMARQSNGLTIAWVLLSGLTPIVWLLWSGRILFSRNRRPITHFVTAASRSRIPTPQKPEIIRNVPTECFGDVGGLEEAKEQIRSVVQAHLRPEKSKRYGALRNGILLHGPRGTGKTFLARASAGEFGLNFECISAPKLINRWIGATAENIQAVFAQAAARRPVLFFIDEIDALGSGRQDAISDPGGAGREFNNITTALMSAIDHCRDLDGFVLMAATNRLDGLDEALIREGRFDVKLRIDLPNEATRIKILEAQLSKKPWKRFDVEEFARRTPGTSAAKLRALVDEAAGYALADNRKINREDLLRALNGNGGNDRPNLEMVNWDDVVLEASVQQDLKSLIRLLEDPARTRAMGLELPTGLLLVGPPGTGKTLIARLIASQTRRSFYPLTAANVLGGGVGESVKRLAGVFSRARENSPAIIFLDEMDGLLPANNRYLSQHDIQVVEQFLTEISSLEADNNVFLVGTANHADSIDPRVLRGGRFSEKIQIDPPATANRIRLVSKYVNGAALDATLSVADVAEYLQGLAPADIQAVCVAAKRMAFNRSPHSDQLPPLNRTDFEKAFERVHGGMVKAGGTSSQ
jgi:transitional endoplasmic reticulum ATPase